MAATLTAVFEMVDRVSASMDSMADSGSRAVDQWERAEQSADKAFDTATSGARETATAADGVATSAKNMGKSVDDAGDAADEAAKGVEKFGDESEEAGRKGEEFGKTSSDAVQMLQNALIAAGVAKLLKEIADGFVAAVKASIEFESAVTGVYKTVDGTAAQLAAISDETQRLATVMPASTTEIAGVAEAAGQLGIATDDIMGFTAVMINLGEATNLTSDIAASSLAKFSNITGMAATQYENLGSTIVALGNNFATTEADITMMATRMASAGTLAGLTEPEILALAAAMSSVGIEADAGGSSMSKLLAQMQIAVETGSDQLENFASVAGMTGDEFAGAWGESAVDALMAFITGLNDTERNGKTATVVLEEMGLTEIRLSNAIKSLASNSDGLSAALDTANEAWAENTALSREAELRYGTLESRMAMMDNASNNLAIAFGDVLAPAVGSVVDFFTDIFTGLTEFIKRNPAVVSAITGVAVAVGVVAVALAGYVIATKVAKVATVAMTAVMNMNPVFLAVTAITALVVGIVALVSTLDKSENEYDTWTEKTRKQYDALQDLNSEYEEACKQYGETSDEARYLAWEIENLNSEFENSKQTLEEYIEECEGLNESLNEMLDANRAAFQEVSDNEGTTLALVRKLEELAAQTDITTETQEQMKAIIDELNETVPELALSYEDVVGGVTDFAAAIEQAVKAQAAMQRYEAAQQGMVDAYNAMYEAEQQLADLREQEASAQERYNTAEQEYLDMLNLLTRYDTTGMAGLSALFMPEKKELDNATDALASYQEQIAALEETYTTAEDDYQTYLDALVDYADQTEEAAESSRTYEEAVHEAINSVQEDMDELCKAYDAAYEAARTNLDGTVGLFEKVEEQAGLSTTNIIAAWQSQIDFFNAYNENLQALEELGIDPELLKQLSDGSAESIGQVQALADELAGLDAEAAATTVDTINEKFGELTEAKDAAATTMAQIQTDFDTKLSELETRMTTAIDNMNMDTEAATAAKATMEAYAQAIRDNTSGAVTAAEAASRAVAAALNTSYTGGTVTTVTGHAKGTTFAEDVFVAGENGPELIVGAGGSTVFPTDETNRIINAVNSDPGGDVAIPDAGGVKKVLLEIAGRGNINFSGNTDKETVIGILYEYLKPVLSEILTQEIFEEGDMSYEY